MPIKHVHMYIYVIYILPLYWDAYQVTQRFIFYRLSIKHRDDTDLENVKLTARERRFIKFASVEFEDQLYMTPQDFLESVVEQEPRREH